jgi:hypothetical protein
MRVEIIQGGRTLRQYNHEGRSYIEAPPEGDYFIRLTNDSGALRLAVISVDAINVVDGTDAGHNGPGYVLRSWETVTIKGWRRSDSRVAAFNFKGQEESYATQSGRGSKNVGVIGVAVFDEKPKPRLFTPSSVEIHHHHHHWDSGVLRRGLGSFGTPEVAPPTTTTTTLNSVQDSAEVCEALPAGGVACAASLSSEESGDSRRPLMGSGVPMPPASYYEGEKPRGGTLDAFTRECSFSSSDKATKSVSPRRSPTRTLGTGYGGEVSMFTTTTEFERATENPVQVIALYYGTREQLREWGVPIIEPSVTPDPFPASTGPSVAPPPGWRG